MALTTVDLPWATCPMVPMLIVACCEMTSGDKAVSSEGSMDRVARVSVRLLMVVEFAAKDDVIMMRM